MRMSQIGFLMCLSTMDWLRPVSVALDERGATLFFRDDDAGWGDARLIELLDVFAAHSLPVDLAVIPLEVDLGLAAELVVRSGVGLHQHGLAHVNHERAARKCEFGPSRGAASQARDISTGRERLGELLGARLDPIFTPPWNRCTLDTARCLASLGFGVLSRESRAGGFGVPGLLELPVSVDFVRLDAVEAGERIAAAIRAGGPVGVMFHHEVMDAGAMARTGELLGLVAGHERARAVAMMELASARAG